MNGFYLDENLAPALAESLRDLHRAATTVDQQGMTRALDSEHLLFAARSGWVLLTQDRGLPALHEAWRVWTQGRHGGGPHPGISRLARDGCDDADLAAERIKPFLRSRNPAGELWLFSLKPGWQRCERRPESPAWAVSPLDPG